MAGSILEPIAGLVLVFGVAIPLMVYYARSVRKRQREEGFG